MKVGKQTTADLERLLVESLCLGELSLRVEVIRDATVAFSR